MEGFVCCTTVALALACRAGSAFFDFNEDPTLSGLVTLYGSATWQPTAGVGAATNSNDGYLEVTPSTGGQRGAVVFADFDNGAIIKAFTLDADVRIGNGSIPPADGFSINYVRANDPVLSDVNNGGDPSVDAVWATGPNCETNLPEEGTHTGISVGFDAWASGGIAPYCDEENPSIGPDNIGVDVRVDGKLVLQYPAPTLNGDCNDPTSIQTGPTDNTGTPDGLCWAHVKAVLETNAQLSVYWKGALILSNYQTSYIPSPGRLVVGGRTGAAWEYHQVDNIGVVTIVESPRLSIIASGANVVLTWPTNQTFFLQSTANLVSTPVWTAVSTASVVVNGQNTVTNPISGTQQFFRLSQ